MEGSAEDGMKGVAVLRSRGLPSKVLDQVEDWVWAVWDNSEPDREDSAAEVDDTEDDSDESGEDSEEDIVEEEDDEEEEEEVLDEEMEAV